MPTKHVYIRSGFIAFPTNSSHSRRNYRIPDEAVVCRRSHRIAAESRRLPEEAIACRTSRQMPDEAIPMSDEAGYAAPG